MFSQCPECQAIFQVSDAHLKAANGNVRCGQCLAIFDARKHRRDDLLDNNPLESSTDQVVDSQSKSATENTKPSGSVEDELEYSVYIEHFDDAAEGLDELAIEADELESGRSRTKKSAVTNKPESSSRDAADSRKPSRRRGDARQSEIPAAILEQLQAEKAERLRPSRAPWIIGNLVLVLVLLGQGAYFARNDLVAAYPQWRPWLEQACRLAKCQIEKAYDLSQVEIINRDVRTNPAIPDALIASTTLINNADFSQPYPLLTLRFSDITGTALAQRRFTPEEYLPSGYNINSGMPPNLPIVIELKLMDPGKAAVNFEFFTEIDPRQRLQQDT